MGKVIALDMDDVIADTNVRVAQYLNKQYGTSHTRADMKSYYLEHLWPIGTEAEAVRHANEYVASEDHASAGMVAGAKEGIQALRALGHQIVIVTSRPLHVERETRQWLEANIPGLYDQIHFTSHFFESRVSKAEVCKKIGAAVLVEDALHHAEDVAAAGIPVLLFDAPWNTDKKDEPNITRVHSWGEVVAWGRERL